MHIWRTMARAAVLAAAVACALGGGAAYAATPTTPVMRDVFVTPRASLATSPTVTVQWSASTDASGHAIVYDVYRDVIPVTGATIVSRSLAPVATGVTGTSAIINAASAETTQSYVWYYAVVARDSLGNKSGVSYNMSPNVHSNRVDPNQVSCPRCHQVHGAYRAPYQTKEACYYCHGSTGESFATGAKSTYNTEASFFDTGTVAAGSKHRNAAMTSTRQECTACHTPHRSPFFYDAAGVYQASLSYRRMLRIEYPANTYTYYSRNDSPQGNAFCFGCHGANSGPIAIVGGANAYADSGGDHNSAGYATAAHGPSTVLTNAVDSGNGIQCLACHNKHASRADKLVDYRSQGTTASQAGGAAVCFACHSNATTDTRLVGTKPYAWNGRDVQAQFTDTATYKSRHPYELTNGPWAVGVATVLAHTTQADFNTYTLMQATTTNTAGGEIVLDVANTTSRPPAPYVLVSHAASNGRVDSYKDGQSAWNADWDPADIGTNPGAGASSAVKNGRVFALEGAAASAIHIFTPPADSGTGAWSRYWVPTAWGGFNAGSDLVFDSTHDLLWALATSRLPSSTNTNIKRTLNFTGSAFAWYTGIGSGGPAFRIGGVYYTLGAGSTLAWVPANGTRPERLYVVNRSGTQARNGQLYYYSAPLESATGDKDWVSTGRVLGSTGTTADAGSRMVYFRIGTTDYLYFLRGAANVQYLIQLANNTTTETDTVLINGTANPWNANVGEGCSLVWNGDTTQTGFRLYATRGNNDPSFKIATWNGSTLAWSDGPDLAENATAGTYLSYVTADPADTSYYVIGTATTPDITPAAPVHHWGTLAWTESEPSGTDLRVTVEGYNGFAWQTLANSVDSGPIDLTAYSTTAYPKIRLRAELYSSNGLNTPWLYDWTLTGVYDRLVAAYGSLTCLNCHNVHSVGKGTAGTAWSMARASDPDDTKLAAPSDPTTFCLRCHDGTPPLAATDATTVVPYTVTFSEQTAPFFPGWNKAASGADFASSGHKATTIQKLVGQFGCQTCHDPHASQNARLTAISQTPDGSTSSGHLNVSRDTSTTWSEQALCYGCHDGRRSGTCSSSGCHNTDMSWLNVSTPFGLTYRHPVERSGRHTDTETASQLGSTNRHAECVDCHDPHALRRGRHTTGSSLAGEAIRGATGVRPTAWPANWTAVPAGNRTTERLDGQSTDYEAYLCLKCHSSYSGQPFTATRSNGATYTSTDQALEFNPSNFSYHNVFGQSTGMQSSFTFVDSGGTQRTVTWQVPTINFFVSGSSWTTNSMMTCTECHTNSTASAKGPHGSSVQWLLDPAYPTDWGTAELSNSFNGMTPSNVICAKCHDLDGPGFTNTWSNNVHPVHASAATDGRCVVCHIKIPHGWKRPRLLVYTNTDGIYAAVTSGLTGIRATSPTNTLAPLNIDLDSNGRAVWDDLYCTSNCGGHATALPAIWP